MAKLIDKSAVVAEIERLIAELVEEGEDTMFEQGRISAFEDVKVFINHTLEMKEVDLEQISKNYALNNTPWDDCMVEIQDAFKSGFELGLKAQEGGQDLEVKEVNEEPTSKDLEEAADKHLVEKGYLLTTKNGEHLAEVEAKGLFKAGAKWQKEQMEKNRIAHCDNITEEQYNLETGFLDDFLDKNKRMPTFLDAIEYGMKKAMEE